ncbi:MAG: ROK family protein [Actinomycetota bacterium]
MRHLRIGNKKLIKDINRSIVLNQIRSKGSISRTDISKNTKLALSTITNIIDSLIREKLVFETGTESSTGGRRPISLQFNYGYAHVFGVKVEKDNIIIALTDLKADIKDKLILSYEKDKTGKSIINVIKKGINQLLIKNKKNKKIIMGIGIAISGLTNNNKGILVHSSFLGLKSINFRNELNKEFKVPIYIDNDVNAYTLAEFTMGYGKDESNFICISVGEGIGAGIVINNKVYYGQIGGAGEFGHTIISKDGYPCHCGQCGCLEMYASDKYFQLRGREISKDFKNSSLNNSKFSFDEVYEAAKDKNDPLALQLFKEKGINLGIGIVNLINILNPSRIIFMGENLKAKEFFLKYTIKTANNNFFDKADFKTKFFVSKLGDNAWEIGAALLAINRLFEVPLYDKKHSI